MNLNLNRIAKIFKLLAFKWVNKADKEKNLVMFPSEIQKLIQTDRLYWRKLDQTPMTSQKILMLVTNPFKKLCSRIYTSTAMKS